MIKRSFYFIRHGQTDWNLNKRLQGYTDTELNETGRTQAKDAVKYLENLSIDRIVASPMKRAFETAQIINETLNSPMETDAGLKERCFGVFEGKTTEEIMAMKTQLGLEESRLEPTGYACPPKAESHDALVERVFAAVNKALNGHDDKVLFVAHGGVFAALAYVLLSDGIYRHSDNTTPYHFIHQPNQPWRVINLKEGKESFHHVAEHHTTTTGNA